MDIIIATTEDLKFFNAVLKKGDTESKSKTKVRIPRKESINITSLLDLATSKYLSTPDMRIFFATSELIYDEPYHTLNTITLRREIDYSLYFDHPHQMIRAVVAQKGHKLAVLVDDLNPIVRREVAKHWYGLDKLKKDSDIYVQAEALSQLELIKQMQEIKNAQHTVEF